MSGEARILVVDDVPPNVRLLEAVLMPRGYDGHLRDRRRAFGLARPLADLLIGRSMLPARLEKVYAILEESPSVDDLSVQAVYGGPQEVMVAAKVHPAPGRTADELAEVFIDLTSHRRSHRGGQ